LVKYRTDIAAVQEIRCKLVEVMSLKEYILINTGRKENDYGTGFMVRKHCKPNIMGYKLINEEICVLRIQGRLFNTTYKSIQAPTEGKDTEEKGKFYENLEQICNQTPLNDKNNIGDFNGKKMVKKLLKPITGLHSMKKAVKMD
jgi:exonuclease III